MPGVGKDRVFSGRCSVFSVETGVLSDDENRVEVQTDHENGSRFSGVRGCEFVRADAGGERANYGRSHASLQVV